YEGDAGHEEHGASPAEAHHHRGDYRQEQELAGGGAGREQAQHDAPAFREPAIGDHGSEDGCLVPVPSPTTTPHSNASCHDAVIKVVRATPAATSASDVTMTRRTPRRSRSQAMNRPDRPQRDRF